MQSSNIRIRREICEVTNLIRDENCQEVLNFIKRIKKIEIEREKYDRRRKNVHSSGTG